MAESALEQPWQAEATPEEVQYVDQKQLGRVKRTGRRDAYQPDFLHYVGDGAAGSAAAPAMANSANSEDTPRKNDDDPAPAPAPAPAAKAKSTAHFSAMDYLFSDDEADEELQKELQGLDQPIENFASEWGDAEKSADGMLPDAGIPLELKRD